MSNEILVPVDGSPLAEAALHYACDTFPTASLTLLHVVDLFEPGYGSTAELESTYEPLMGSAEWYEQAESTAESILEDAQMTAEDYDQAVGTHSDIGDPKRVIVDYATEEGMDQIVIGAHGRDDKSRPVFGTVAEIVTRRATVPVTVVR